MSEKTQKCNNIWSIYTHIFACTCNANVTVKIISLCGILVALLYLLGYFLFYFYYYCNLLICTKYTNFPFD